MGRPGRKAPPVSLGLQVQVQVQAQAQAAGCVGAWVLGCPESGITEGQGPARVQGLRGPWEACLRLDLDRTRVRTCLPGQPHCRTVLHCVQIWTWTRTRAGASRTPGSRPTPSSNKQSTHGLDTCRQTEPTGSTADLQYRRLIIPNHSIRDTATILLFS